MSVLESPSYLGQKGSRTLFSIECKNGKCIREHSCFPDETEVLLLPGFSFEVTSKLNAGNGLYVIGLKQIVSTSEETSTSFGIISSTSQVDNIHVL